jgi:hypothetical protein
MLVVVGCIVFRVSGEYCRDVEQSASIDKIRSSVADRFADGSALGGCDILLYTWGH